MHIRRLTVTKNQYSLRVKKKEKNYQYFSLSGLNFVCRVSYLYKLNEKNLAGIHSMGQ